MEWNGMEWTWLANAGWNPGILRKTDEECFFSLHFNGGSSDNRLNPSSSGCTHELPFVSLPEAALGGCKGQYAAKVKHSLCGICVLRLKPVKDGLDSCALSPLRQ